MAIILENYLSLVTGYNQSRPNFIAMMSALLQPLVNDINTMFIIPSLYDVDVAVGEQEDTVGLWVGISRIIAIPLTGVYFSWNTSGIGWNQGSWAPSGLPTELVSLGDDAYRTLLRARIVANNWDGTIPGAYAAWNMVFSGTGYGILIQDLGGMEMIYALTGPSPDAVTKALFVGGYLNLKPAGVRINYYLTPDVPNNPYMGWSVETATISGWNVGYWGVQSPGM